MFLNSTFKRMHSLTSGAGNDGRLGIVTTESFLPEKYKQKTFCRFNFYMIWYLISLNYPFCACFSRRHLKITIIFTIITTTKSLSLIFSLSWGIHDMILILWQVYKTCKCLGISSGILRTFSYFNKSSNYVFSRVCLSVCHSVSSRVSSCDRDLSKLSLGDRPLLSHTLGSPTPPDMLVSGWLGISRHIWSSF